MSNVVWISTGNPLSNDEIENRMKMINQEHIAFAVRMAQESGFKVHETPSHPPADPIPPGLSFKEFPKDGLQLDIGALLGKKT